MARTYGQFCSIARALDTVGERWALLVVRELLLGPCRYSDLLSGLPGIGTNVLATRLRQLEDAGVVERLQLKSPAPALVYQLTDDGQQLRDVIDALARWGTSRLDRPSEGDRLEPRWFAFCLTALIDPQGAGDDVIELHIDEDAFTIVADGDRYVARRGSSDATTATLTGALGDFFATAKGDTRAVERVAIEGDVATGRQFVESMKAVLSPRRPE